MLMFAIVFGLSMDYEVFLISRVHEPWTKTADAHRSVAIGIGSTARVITTAAAIMIVVFTSFVLDPDPTALHGWCSGPSESRPLCKAGTARCMTNRLRAKLLTAQALWLVGFLAYLTVQVLIGRQVGSLGAHVLIFVSEFGCAVVFWTFSPYLLLLGKIAWRAALLGGIATGLCLTELSIFSALVLSSSIVSGNEN